jgi:exodeoxyribonuclease-3
MNVNEAESTTLTVMSFNIWGGGDGQASAVNETAHAIRAANADVVGVQETRREGDPCTAEHCPPAGDSVAKELASLLGWHYYEQTAQNAALWANAILSRFEIVAASATPNDLGVRVRLDDAARTEVYAFNVHFSDYPYQPYQLMRIPYGDSPFITTADQAVAQASLARGAGLDLLLADIAAVDPAFPSFVFGDFNEPADGDWNAAAVAAGLQPLAVRWPTTRAIVQRGFVDAYRVVYPDVAKKPAYTFTPTTQAPPDKHDRIDQLLVRGAVVENAWIVGEAAPEADIVYKPWPSDHRAVAARVRVAQRAAAASIDDTIKYILIGLLAALLLVLTVAFVAYCRRRALTQMRERDMLMPLDDPLGQYA